MFGFKRRAARTGTGGLSSVPKLEWDLHAHLLPGVDDGVRTLDDALAVIRRLRELGYRGSVLTPHVYHGLYPNTRATLEPVLRELRAALAAASIDYSVQMAAEYFADEHLIELAEREPLLTFGGGALRYVLIEYPYSTEPLLWADAVTALLRGGYTPVLAHIERYRFVINSPDVWLARFADLGVKIQCNIGSLAGQYGKEAFEFARRMRDEGVPTFWGTDLHRIRQIDAYIVPGLSHLTEAGELNPTLRE